MGDAISILEKIADWYRFVALTAFNVGVMFLLLNVGVIAWNELASLGGSGNPVAGRYGEETLSQVYPDVSRQELRKLLGETWSRPYEYEPFTQFREQPYAGEYVNVDRAGFRNVEDQGPWPPDPTAYNVFVFGGSTAFGYGVADRETIASHLQQVLRERFGFRVNVYNFGRGHYYSTQERLLFERLLTQSHVPDAAVFIDGLNEYYYDTDQPLFSERLGRLIPGSVWSVMSEVLPRMPVMTLLPGPEAPQTEADPERIRAITDRYLRDLRLAAAAARAFEVQPLFVWQPVPTYKYDDAHHPFVGRGYGRHGRSRAGYVLMAQRVALEPPGAHFLWAADLQEGLAEPLYVDKVHYTSRMSRLIAEFIGATGAERRLWSEGR